MTSRRPVAAARRAASSVARVEARTSRAQRAAARVPTRRARGREEHALSGYAPSDGHVPSAHAVASARPSAHRVSASASALAAMPREPPSARRVLPRAIEPAKRGTGGSCARREGVGRRRRSWMQTTPCFWRRGVSVVVCAHYAYLRLGMRTDTKQKTTLNAHTFGTMGKTREPQKLALPNAPKCVIFARAERKSTRRHASGYRLARRITHDRAHVHRTPPTPSARFELATRRT